MDREEGDRGRRRNYSLRRAIMDYGMGVLILAVGVVVLLAPKLKIAVAIDDLARYMFFGLCMLYGGFRIYRGTRKDYFND
jgi:hypothetical protein